MDIKCHTDLFQVNKLKVTKAEVKAVFVYRDFELTNNYTFTSADTLTNTLNDHDIIDMKVLEKTNIG